MRQRLWVTGLLIFMNLMLLGLLGLQFVTGKGIQWSLLWPGLFLNVFGAAIIWANRED